MVRLKQFKQQNIDIT